MTRSWRTQWRLILVLPLARPFVVGWFRHNRSYRTFFRKGSWWLVLLTVFGSVWAGVNQPVSSAGMWVWGGGMVAAVSMLLLWLGWERFGGVSAFKGDAGRALGQLKEEGIVVQSSDLRAVDLWWVHLLPTPAEHLLLRGRALNKALPPASLPSINRERF